MKKHLFIIALLFFFGKAFGQKGTMEGYVITNENDTIHGMIKEKSYSGKIKIYVQGKKKSFSPKKIIAFKMGNFTYVKSEFGVFGDAFFKKTYTGAVNMYQIGKKNIRLGKYDNDIDAAKIKISLKLYCNDYPDFSKCLDTINKKNVQYFLIEYDKWKKANPTSKSFYEINMHSKPLLNYKLSYFLPGAGIELGLNKHLTIYSTVKFEFGVRQNNFFVNPLLHTNLRFFYDQNRRERQNKRTYKYSGNYVSLVHMWYPQGTQFIYKDYNLIGMHSGWQRTYGKHWCSNIGFGGAYGLENGDIYILYYFDFGYSF